MKSTLPFLLRVLLLAVLALGLALPGAAAPVAPDGGRLVLLSKLDGPVLPEGLNVLEDYGAFVLVQMPEAQLAALPAANVMDQMADRTVISLTSTQWDTQAGEPAIREDLRAATDDPYFIVQFYGPIKEEWKSGLAKLGVTILDYLPNYAYFVRMAPALADKVLAAHAVQWVGHYHPAYRLASDEELAQAETDGDRLAVEVSTFPGADAAAFRSGAEAVGATIELFETRDDGALMARAWATRAQLPALAALRGVFRVEPYSQPQLHNDGATQTMHTRDLWKASRNGLQQDLMGAGQTGGLLDSGLDTNSTSPNILDFYDYTGGTTTSRVIYNAAGAGCGGSCTSTDSASGHGTHVAGTMVGNGYASLAQRGLTSHATAADPYFDYAWAVGQAPEAKIAVVHVGGSGSAVYPSVPTDWTTLYNQGARATNNSWGGAAYTYGGNSRTADYVMWTYQDYLLVNSAGNAGPGAYTVSQPANAKNILTVGASDNHRSVWAGDGQTSSMLTVFSSRGPASTTSGDTRFKPDIVAPGANVLSTRSTAIADGTIGLWANEPGDGGGNGTGTLDYAWSGGTSMSSPQITGAALIVRDYYQDIKGLGNTTPPSAALIKATLVNGAVDMGYGYEANTTTYPYGGRNMQGWGMANLEQALTPRAPRSFFYDDFTNISNTAKQSTIGPDGSGDYVEYTVNVTDSSEPLKVTLSWTDYATTSNSAAYVNNLNLLVTPPSGPAYYGNNFTGAWSNTTATYDAQNNTEAVYVQNPAAGTWTIRVALANAPTGTYQPFALIASGGFGVTPATTRTCSGITSCTGRMGASAQAYYPSIVPLTGVNEQVQAGDYRTTTLRVTNWGTNADTISLSAAATDMTGASASGFTVTFTPAGPFSLASGASQDVTATVDVGSGVANGSYDVSLTATSGGTGGRKDVRVLAFNVIPNSSISNTAPIDAAQSVVSVAGPQVSPSFWACPNTPSTLWVAYVDGNSHLGSPAKIYAARSTDNGVTWTKWQVDGNDNYYYAAPAIGGSADCSSVTVAWVRESSTATTSSYWLYSRTYSAGAWGAVGTRDSLLNNANYYMEGGAVAYDNDGHILLAWLHSTGVAGTSGVYSSQSTNNGSTWTTAAAVVTGGTHRYPAFALDTANNHLWMAMSYVGATTGRDIYVKYWDGSTNAWNATNTIVADTSNRENHPAIGYANGKLWVAWNRYADYSAATPVLYYTYSTSTLPTIAWGTTYGPYGARLAEHTPPSITGDATYTYIAYLTYDHTFAAASPATFFRGGNIFALRAPAAGGAPTQTYQLTATADDPPLFARGNAGSPRLQWATTTVNGVTATGPALLYSKNASVYNNPAYGNLGVSQGLFNAEEDFDLFLSQVDTTSPLAVDLASFTAAATSDGVTLAWETVSEVENAGFNVYRAAGGSVGDRPQQEEVGQDDGSSGIDPLRMTGWVRLNETLIPAATPGAAQGNVYTWTDAAATTGTTWYMLEDVDLNGAATRHEPVSVTVAEPNAVGMAGFGAAGTALPALGGLGALALAALAGAAARKRR